MAKYRKKPPIVEASVWTRNGDHPDDGDGVFPPGSKFAGERLEGKVVRYFRHPKVPGDTICGGCKQSFRVHGWIDNADGGQVVCPGDYILTEANGVSSRPRYAAVHQAEFILEYEPIDNK